MAVAKKRRKRWIWIAALFAAVFSVLAYLARFDIIAVFVGDDTGIDPAISAILSGVLFFVLVVITAAIMANAQRTEDLAGQPSGEEPRPGRHVWHYWHGTPQLLAHYFRLANRLAGHVVAQSSMVIEIDGDRETFESADDFLTFATRDALQHFRSIELTAHGPSLQITLRLAWRRPWWKPGFSKDSEVVLDVTGESPEEVATALDLMKTATTRGSKRGVGFETTVQLVSLLLFSGSLIGGAVSVLYLFGVEPEAMVLPAAGALLLGILFGMLWGTWLYPSLEVASHRQSKMWRVARVVGPIVTALVVTGVGKALFGS
jgi:hypothetical protein